MITHDKQAYINNLPEGLPLYYQPAFLDVVHNEWTGLVSETNEGIEWMTHIVKRNKYGINLYAPAELAHDNGIVTLGDKDIYRDSPENVGTFVEMIISDRNKRSPEPLLATFKRSVRHRQYFDLKDYPREFSDFSKRLRNNLRKAQSCRLVCTDEIERFYVLYAMSFERRHIDKWSIERMKSIYRRLAQAFDTRLYVLVDASGRDLATNLLVGHNDTVYGILSAKNYEINQRGSHEYMKYAIIQELRNDYKIWDLGGSNIPGVRRFNMKLGAEDVVYPVYRLQKPTWLWKLRRAGKQ